MKGSWVLTGCSGDGDDFLGSYGILGRWWGAIWQGAVIGGRDGVERQAESVAAIVLIIMVLPIPPAPLLRQEVQGKY